VIIGVKSAPDRGMRADLRRARTYSLGRKK
jgi:hypothetical protein